MKVYYDKDCDQALIKNKNVVIVGYGSQAHAHAQNMKDSGVANIVIALREDSKSKAQAERDGFMVMNTKDAVKTADIVAILVPDEIHEEIWQNDIKNNIKHGTVLAVAHGFSVHFQMVVPFVHMDVIMIAPNGPGDVVRSEYLRGDGVPCLVAIYQNHSGNALNIALSYASAIGAGRSGIIETTFKDECETDLFGEQAVICGSVVNLVLAGFETLVEAGYPAEIAYLNCLHELKLTVDLIHTGGIQNMYNSISNTAEYGAYISGDQVLPLQETKTKMKKVLSRIQSGEFVKQFIMEYKNGYLEMNKRRKEIASTQIEKVGSELRNIMQRIQKNH